MSAKGERRVRREGVEMVVSPKARDVMGALGGTFALFFCDKSFTLF